MPRGKTLKKKGKTTKSASPIPKLTIPELRKSLDYVTALTEDLIRSGKYSVEEAASIFSAEWKKVFGKQLPKETAVSYIQHMMNMKKGVKKGKHTRKHKRQGGGAPIAGAPLDYMTRPGLDIPYGNFLKYVSSGFWNPEPAAPWDTGRYQPVLPYAETGSNRMNGGGIMDSVGNIFAGITSRPIEATNPPSVLRDAQTVWKGQSLGPGPESYQRAYAYQSNNAATSVPLVASQTFERDLNADMITRP
jgi:hypothetical protein